MPTSSASSPSPSTPTITIGKCVVCGKETYLRCEACSRFGTDWMFFCSVEHQRLIWKVHRSVCGPRSNPFQWPRLSQGDVDDFRKIGQQPVIEDGRATGELVMDRWLGGLPQDRTQTEARVEAVLEKLREPEDEFTPESLSLLLSIRRTLFRNRFDRLSTSPGPTLENSRLHKDLVSKHAFDWLASWLDCIAPTTDWTNLNAPWLAGYLHRQLIHHYLLAARGTGLSYPHHAENEVIRFAEEVIAKTHGELAKSISSETKRLSKEGERISLLMK
ncbi:hypothetical protein JCM3765_001190 [Sporobolomyces pararoseus]